MAEGCDVCEWGKGKSSKEALSDTKVLWFIQMPCEATLPPPFSLSLYVPTPGCPKKGSKADNQEA